MKPNKQKTQEFTNKLLSPLEIEALSSNEKINYIDFLQNRLMRYQQAVDTAVGKNENYTY